MDEHHRLALAFVEIRDVDAVVLEAWHAAGIDGYLALRASFFSTFRDHARAVIAA